MSGGKQFLTNTIVVPSASLGTDDDGDRRTAASQQHQQAAGPRTRRERRSRAQSASSGLADVHATKKRGWAPIRRVKRFFSRGSGMNEAQPSQLADHAYNYGDAVKYTPGPDSLHSGRQRHHAHSHSVPEPLSRDDLQRVAAGGGGLDVPDDRQFGPGPGSFGPREQHQRSSGQLKSTAEATRNVSTAETRVDETDTTIRTTTMLFSKTPDRQARERSVAQTPQLELGDQPVRLMVKLITKLKDRNEDPTVNSREVTVSKGRNGFGMTLAGSNPVIVMRVDPNGSADRSGILVGDMIVAVADIDVRRSTQAHVNEMLALASKSPKQLMSGGMLDSEWERVKSMQERLEKNELADTLTGSIESPQQVNAAGVVERRGHDAIDGTKMEPRRSRRISLDLTSDTELSDSRECTPDSVKSLSSNTGNTDAAQPGTRAAEPVSQDRTKAVGRDEAVPAANTSEAPATGEGLRVLIRQKSQKLRAQRQSTGMMDESNALPISVETDEDQEILELINNRHSLLLTEAVERCHRGRLDGKEVDAYISETDETDETDERRGAASSGYTPRSGLSTPNSDDNVINSKSAPTTPTSRRRAKVRRSESHKGAAVIVKQKSGRVLVAPRPRPTILPGDVAARLIDTTSKRPSPHVDSGYISIHQDELDAENLEQALLAANVRIASDAADSQGSGSRNGSVPGQGAATGLGTASDSHDSRDSQAQPTACSAGTESTARNAGKAVAKLSWQEKSRADDASSASSTGVQHVQLRTTKPNIRRAKSMMVTGSTSPLKVTGKEDLKTDSEGMSMPSWRLELQKQREQKEKEQSDQLGSLPTPPTQPASTQPKQELRRMNSANVVASATARKASAVAKEDRSSTPPRDAPSWVSMAKDKSRRASVHGTPSRATETHNLDDAGKDAEVSTAQPLPGSSSGRGKFNLPPKAKAMSTSAIPGIHKRNRMEEEAERQQKLQQQKRASIVITEQEKCIVCCMAVYHSERFSAEGLVFHMGCVRCTTCQRKLHLDKYVIIRKQIYCKQHSMEVSMKLAPNITTSAPMPSMSARGGALSMSG